MNKLSRYLNRPYPVYNKLWHIVAICAVCVAFILAVFEPFNYRLNSIPQLWVLVHFVLMTALGTSIPYILFPKIFKKHYNSETWTIGKTLLNNLLLILFTGIFIITYDMVILPNLVIDHTGFTFFPEGSLKVWVIDIFATITISLIPITVITILTQNSALKQNLKEAILLNQALAKRIRSEHEDLELITLTGNTKESIKILPENLLYIEASGNYADVYYREGDENQHKLLRATIKQI